MKPMLLTLLFVVLVLPLMGCQGQIDLSQRRNALKEMEAKLAAKIASTDARQAEVAKALETATGAQKEALLAAQQDLTDVELATKEQRSEVVAVLKHLAALQADIDAADQETIGGAKDLIGSLPPPFNSIGILGLTTVLGFWRSYQARQINKRQTQYVGEVLTDEQKVQLKKMQDRAVKDAVDVAQGTRFGLPV